MKLFAIICLLILIPGAALGFVNSYSTANIDKCQFDYTLVLNTLGSNEVYVNRNDFKIIDGTLYLRRFYSVTRNDVIAIDCNIITADYTLRETGYDFQ